MRAQSLQRAPTGVWIRHFGQIGVSQRLHRSAVETSGWRAHWTIVAPPSRIGRPIEIIWDGVAVLRSLDKPTYVAVRELLREVDEERSDLTVTIVDR